jgi:hypothetical protein
MCHQFTTARAKSSPGEDRGHLGEAARGLGQVGEPPIKPRAIVEDRSKLAIVTRYPPITASAREPPSVSPHLARAPVGEDLIEKVSP